MNVPTINNSDGEVRYLCMFPAKLPGDKTTPVTKVYSPAVREEPGRLTPFGEGVIICWQLGAGILCLVGGLIWLLGLVGALAVLWHGAR
jgi:hypothetical protein